MNANSAKVKPSIANFKSAVDGELQRLTTVAIAEARIIDPAYAQLLEVVQAALSHGGKRLRPYVSHLAYTGLGGTSTEAFLAVAASQELLHQFLLMHDDIIDRDFTRHGALNLEGTYRLRFLEQGLDPAEALHHAESMALMAGDATAALGLQAITASRFSTSRKFKVLEVVQRMLFEVIGGEFMDVDSSLSTEPLRPDRLLGICRYKTATYSFQTPLQVGAILAGARPTIQQRLRQFGQALGIAFQLADDVLGIYGDEPKLGKSVTSDVTEGKQTLLFYYALELATPAQARRLRQLWGNHKVGVAELDEVRQILRDCGAQTRTDQEAEAYMQNSLSILATIPLAQVAKTELERLAHFCVKRDY